MASSFSFYRVLEYTYVPISFSFNFKGPFSILNMCINKLLVLLLLISLLLFFQLEEEVLQVSSIFSKF